MFWKNTDFTDITRCFCVFFSEILEGEIESNNINAQRIQQNSLRKLRKVKYREYEQCEAHLILQLKCTANISTLVQTWTGKISAN